jgi:long-chain acyl-CoA synthetase
MDIVEKLKGIWKETDYPFLVHSNGSLRFNEIAKQKGIDLSEVRSGDVVALIGDFDPLSILTLLHLINKGVILMPLTVETKAQHEYFFESALVDVVIENFVVKRRKHNSKNELIENLRSKRHAGLVFFSTGTSGRPKAILHDYNAFMKKFETPRPTLKILSFLMFDHLGGINTLMHTLFNKGTVVAPKTRSVECILTTCAEHKVEVLPATPTFLRMMLFSGLIPDGVPDTLRIISYGTERMDQPTLDALCQLLPNVDFRQTFGNTELGVFRVKSESRNSLFMKVGGDGIETRVVNDILEIRSKTRMLGYLNAESPFDIDDWYNTNDIVEVRDGYFKVVGRTSELINVGGLKFMASEVERVALQYEHVELAKAVSKPNPITGEHVEVTVQPTANHDVDKSGLKAFFNEKLPNHMTPKRIRVASVSVGHRFKRT